MKQFKSIFALLCVAVILGSCGVSQNGFGSGAIQKRKYNKGFYFNKKNHFKTEKSVVSNDQLFHLEGTTDQNDLNAIPVIAPKETLQMLAEAPKIPTPNQVSKQQDTKKLATKKKTNANKGQATSTGQRKSRESDYYIPVKKNATHQNNNNNAGGSSDAMFIVAVIFAIIIPPIGVAIYTNVDWKKVLIALLLWLLFILPGVIYALLVVFDVL